MIANVLMGLFYACFVGFAGVLGYDVVKTSKEGRLEKGSPVKSFITGVLTDAGDAIGIGAFAPTVFFMKIFKIDIKDKQIPPTLNVSHTLSVLLEAILFTKAVKVDPVTLAVLIAAAVVGSYFGAGIVAKMNEKKLQIVMGVALFVSALLMLLSHPMVGLFPAGGNAVGLTGIKLVIGAVGNFILGALMTAGIGLYAPCMAMVSFLGMSPSVAFPIMMGSCALLMPVASVKFIKEDAYSKKNALLISIGGLIGVIIALKLFTGLSIDTLKFLVIGVISLTSFGMLKSAFSKEKEPESKPKEIASL